jgi:hypothetical protein
MRINVTSVDHAPSDLEAQTPFQVELLRKIHSSDRPDCWIAIAAKPIRSLREGHEVQVTHLIVWPRWQGTQIGPGMKQTPIGITYVIDSSVLNDSSLDSKKCIYVAIGTADELPSTT